MHTTSSIWTSVVAGLALITTSAAMSMDSCNISHNSGNGGNEFTMAWSGVPSISSSTICGSFAADVKGLTSANSMTLVGSVTCDTDGSSMNTQLTINKQSCSDEANVIVQAMQTALGSAGTLADGTKCTFTGVC